MLSSFMFHIVSYWRNDELHIAHDGATQFLALCIRMCLQNSFAQWFGRGGPTERISCDMLGGDGPKGNFASRN
jgi:hypothetical protein